MTAASVSMDDVAAAAARIGGVVNRTPVITSRQLDDRLGATVFLKAECFQRTGSFKFRGAYNTIAALPAEQRERGVVAFSSGNHAQAVALAASLHGVPSVIVMPEDAPVSKARATEGYGAEIVWYDRYDGDPAVIGAGIATSKGLTLVPPFDHDDVIAGQGTAALELLDDVGPLDDLVVCVGGGGLIAGCAVVAAAQPSPVRVVGVEPAAGDDVKRSHEAGRIIEIPTPRTIADGQQTTAPGERTFAVIRRHVDRIALATDDEIRDAMRFAFQRLRIVLEPSGACALAALLAGHVDIAGRRVGVTLSGGNIDIARFTDLLA